MNCRQSEETYAKIWNIEDSEMWKNKGIRKGVWYLSTSLDENAQLWILVPWMHGGAFGVLCISGKDLGEDVGAPWLQYKCRFHRNKPTDRDCMETEGEDIGDTAELISSKFTERRMVFQNFRSDAEGMTFWESLWKVFVKIDVRRWTVLAEHPDWIYSQKVSRQRRYIKTYWGIPWESLTLVS